MIQKLPLFPLDVDGCAASVTDPQGKPIYKPWRAMVYNTLAMSIGGFQCDRRSHHSKLEGGKLIANSAFYRQKLCRAVHQGLRGVYRNVDSGPREQACD